jgi:hypothetical protein
MERIDFLILENGLRWIRIVEVVSNLFGRVVVKIYNDERLYSGRAKQTPYGLLVYPVNQEAVW